MKADLPPEFVGATPVELAIAKLELRQGDVLALKFDARLSQDARARIREWATSTLPSGVKCMVLEKGVELSIIRAEGGQ